MQVMKKFGAFAQKQADKTIGKAIDHQKHGAQDAAKNLLMVIQNPKMHVSIREAYAVAAWDHCRSTFTTVSPRDVFASFFGPGLMRWIDQRPESAGRLDEYMKGSL